MLIERRLFAGRKAFTLIELLIVVAIIAILAAIAVPNFLEAQVRAKVSRVKSDFRTIGVGLEAYAVDTNSYLPTWHQQQGLGYGAMTNDQIFAQAFWDPEWFLPQCQDYIDICGRYMTTPIAYLANIPHPSPFQMVDPWFRQRGAFYYTAIRLGNDGKPTATGLDSGYGNSWWWAHSQWGNENAAWGLMDGGPDGTWFAWQAVGSAAGQYDVQVQYDPTNGTISWGNIWWLGSAQNR